jgi:hypothetical protein
MGRRLLVGRKSEDLPVTGSGQPRQISNLKIYFRDKMIISRGKRSSRGMEPGIRIKYQKSKSKKILIFRF